MKVYIGPYVNWIGPYQVADWLQKFGVSEEKCHEIGERLSKTWFGDLLQWIHNQKKRKISVRIDKYDTWNADNTLAHIILPMLMQLRQDKHGAPFVDNDDVPEELRDTDEEAVLATTHGDVTEKHFQRWDWVMNEMIWSFEQELDDSLEMSYFYFPENEDLDIALSPDSKSTYDRDGHMAYMKRKQNGFRLFGKYYSSLWD